MQNITSYRPGLPNLSFLRQNSVIAMEAKKITKGKGGLYILRGPAIFLDKASKNNRNYISETVHECVERLQYFVNKRALFGELEHPVTQDIERIARIEYANIAHRIDKIWFDQATNAYWIEITILDNPRGQDVASVLDIGSPVYVSLRSLLDPRKTYVEPKTGIQQSHMMALVTIDIVLNPGYEDAEMQIVSKSANENVAFIAALESCGIDVSEVAIPSDNPILAQQPYGVGDGTRQSELKKSLTLNMFLNMMFMKFRNGSKIVVPKSVLDDNQENLSCYYDADACTISLTKDNETEVYQCMLSDGHYVIGAKVEHGEPQISEPSESLGSFENVLEIKTIENMKQKENSNSGMYKIAVAATEEMEISETGEQVTKTQVSEDLIDTNPESDSVFMESIISAFSDASESEKTLVLAKMAELGHTDLLNLSESAKGQFVKLILDNIQRLNDIKTAALYERLSANSDSMIASESYKNKQNPNKQKTMYKIVANESEQVNKDGNQVIVSAVATDLIPETMSNQDVSKTIDYLLRNLFPSATDAERETVAKSMSKIAIDITSKDLNKQQQAIFAKSVLDNIHRFNDLHMATYYPLISELAENNSIGLESRIEALQAVVELQKAIVAVESNTTFKVGDTKVDYTDNVIKIDHIITAAEILKNDDLMKKMKENGLDEDIKESEPTKLFYVGTCTKNGDTLKKGDTSVYPVEYDYETYWGLENYTEENEMYAIVANEELENQENMQVVTSDIANDFVIPETLSNDDINRTIDYLIGNSLASANDSEQAKVASDMTESGVDLSSKQGRAKHALCILQNVSGAYSVDMQAYKEALELIAIGETPATESATPFVMPERLSNDDFNRTIDYAIRNIFESATESENTLVMQSLESQGLNINELDEQGKSKLFLAVMEHVENALTVDMKPYQAMASIIADGRQIATEDLETIRTKDYTIAVENVEVNAPKVVEPEKVEFANESVAALTQKYAEIAKMRNSEFEGIFALENIPNAFTGLFNGLSTNAKRVLAARAANVTTASENLKFWTGINFMEVEKAVIATESAIIKGKTEAEIAIENRNKTYINFLAGAKPNRRF